MKLYVGLGNPGIKYAMTRHNMGFMAIDYLAATLKIEFDKSGFKGMYCKTKIKEEDVILFKPLTFMNLSGDAVRAIIDFYKISLNDVVIVYDDLDLPVGKIRIREKGSSGGQNGMKHIIAQLHTEEIKRIRMGIGQEIQRDAVDFVLSKMNEEEKELVKEACIKTSKALIDFASLDFNKVMNRYN